MQSWCEGLTWSRNFFSGCESFRLELGRPHQQKQRNAHGLIIVYDVGSRFTILIDGISGQIVSASDCSLDHRWSYPSIRPWCYRRVRCPNGRQG